MSEKEIAGWALGAFAALGGYYFLSLKTASEKLVPQITPMIHRINLSGITIRLKIKITNPTDTTIKIAKPFISLEHNGSILGSSKISPSDADYSISKGTKVFDPVDIELRFLDLAQAAPGVLASYRKTGKLTFLTRITSKALGFVPIDKTIETSI